MSGRAKQGLGTAAVLCAMALAVLDAGMVGVALPTIGADFGEAPDRSLLVVTAYQLALLAGLLPCAHVADRFGYRRLFLAGIATFGTSAALCAVAPTLPLLVAARFAQGLGGAAIMSLGIALLRMALGEERLAAAIGWNALVVALCSALGPAVGAFLLSVATWRWLFVMAVPIAAVALIAARSLPVVKPAARPLDPLGIALYAGAAGSLVVAAAVAAQAPLGAVIFAIAGLASATWLWARDRRRAAPLLPLDLLALRPFQASAAASVFFFTGQSAGLLALPFYLQLSLGRSAMTTGLVLASWPLAVAGTSPVASRLAGRFETGSLCAAGGLLLACGLAATALWPVHESIVPVAACAVLSGLGFGLFQVPNNRNMFLAAPPDRSAAAGGVQGTARLAGQTAGALIVAFALSVWPVAVAPNLAFGVAAGAALIAALISVRHNATSRIASSPHCVPTPFGGMPACAGAGEEPAGAGRGRRRSGRGVR